MILNITYQYILILGLDILIIILLLIVFARIGRNKGVINKIDMMQLNNLKKSLENVMMESEKISNDLIKTFDNSIRSFNEIHEKICTKEKRLEDNISHAEELIKTIESIKSKQRPGNTDPYNIAAELILKGYSAEDVQKECGLSINEIELIKQLSFHKKNSSVVG